MESGGCRPCWDSYVEPAVFIEPDLRVGWANRSARAFFGSPHEGVRCHKYIFGLDNPCGACCIQNMDQWKPTSASTRPVRRRRVVRCQDGVEREFYVTASPYCDMDSSRQGQLEIYSGLPRPYRAIPRMIEFANRLESLWLAEDIYRAWGEFLGTEGIFPQCRWRRYELLGEGQDQKLVCLDCDTPANPAYIPDLKGRVISVGASSASFACLKEDRWFILTPDPEKVQAFKTQFRAVPRQDNPKIYDANVADLASWLRLSLYHYEPGLPVHPESDGILPNFLNVPNANHTFLDIPIAYQGIVRGKVSIVLADERLLELREYLEDLALLEGFVRRRLAAIETRRRDEDASAHAASFRVAQDILHEVAQPAYAGLTCMELLRERDNVCHTAPSADPVDFYLKKNIETSLRMVIFLNDEGRILQDASSFSAEKCRFLATVLAPMVNLMRFCIYDRYQKLKGVAIQPQAIDDADLEKEQGKKPTIRAVYDNVTYEIRYDKACANVQLYAEKYRLQQVFYNLLNNALKYKGQHRDYKVSIDYVSDWPLAVQGRSASDLYHIVDVSDEGAGIDPNEREVIFRLGNRGHRAREISRLPGTGRGLTFCRQVLRGMGGDIYVQRCESPTIFRLLIPKECGISDWPKKVLFLQARTRALVDPIIGGASDA
jgi:signal transduction histidine kinase